MKNYNAYEPGLFEVTEEELKKLTPKEFSQSVNMGQIKHYLQMLFRRSVDKEVNNIRKFNIPKNLKRTNMDNACLIVFNYGDKIFAKRHNNSQHLRV